MATDRLAFARFVDWVERQIRGLGSRMANVELRVATVEAQPPASINLAPLKLGPEESIETADRGRSVRVSGKGVLHSLRESWFAGRTEFDGTVDFRGAIVIGIKSGDSSGWLPGWTAVSGDYFGMAPEIDTWNSPATADAETDGPSAQFGMTDYGSDFTTYGELHTFLRLKMDTGASDVFDIDLGDFGSSTRLRRLDPTGTPLQQVVTSVNNTESKLEWISSPAAGTFTTTMKQTDTSAEYEAIFTDVSGATQKVRTLVLPNVSDVLAQESPSFGIASNASLQASIGSAGLGVTTKWGAGPNDFIVGGGISVNRSTKQASAAFCNISNGLVYSLSASSDTTANTQNAIMCGYANAGAVAGEISGGATKVGFHNILPVVRQNVPYSTLTDTQRIQAILNALVATGLLSSS